MEYANKLFNNNDSCVYNKHARAQNKARSFVYNTTVKMELFRPETAKALCPPTVCVEYCVPCSKASFSSKAHNTQQTFQLSNLEFRRFLMEVSISCTMEIYNEAAIFRRVQARYTRIFIIFILKTTSIGSHVREKSN